MQVLRKEVNIQPVSINIQWNSDFTIVDQNDIPDLTINLLCPGRSYSKLYGAQSLFNNIRFNDIPGITMEI